MPDPKKTEGKKKPESSTIKKIVGKAVSALGSYTPVGIAVKAGRDKISRVALDRMSKNLDPYSYSSEEGNPVVRAANAILMNKPESARTETEQFVEKGYGRVAMPDFKERVDLLQMLTNKKQKYNTIEKSEYKPRTNAEEGVQYHKSKGLEKLIIERLGLKNRNIKWQKDVVDMITPIALNNPKTNKPMIRRSGVVADVPGLGSATYGVGRDKKGVYLDYKDVWDLNPNEGVNSDEGKSIGSETTLGSIKNKIISGAKKVAISTINATATPPKVYGRIYFDPKTGKPIQ